jgi:hypothetical protein
LALAALAALSEDPDAAVLAEIAERRPLRLSLTAPSTAAMSTRPRPRATIVPMPYGFKYLLVTPDGEPG